MFIAKLVQKAILGIGIFGGASLFSFTTLNLEDPVELSNSGNSPVDVIGSSDGFLVTWVDSSQNIWVESSADGKTWTDVTTELSGAKTYSRIARCPLGLLVTWTSIPPGGSPSGNPIAGFSPDNGVTWHINNLQNTQTVAYDLPICGSPLGFLVTYPFPAIDSVDYNAVFSFSPDGTTWSLTGNLNTDYINGTFPPTSAYNGGIFLAAWVNNDLTGVYTVSADGSTWASPAAIPMTTNLNSPISVTAIGSVFIITWADTTGNGWSSYTTDNGTIWSAPSQITTNVNTSNYPTVFANGSSEGLIATWGSLSATGYASVSNDYGTTWGEAIAVTAFGEYNSGYWVNFMGVSVVGNQYVFTWLDVYGNVYARPSAPSSTSFRAFGRPSNRRL
jgi:hypothetical protein